MPSMQAPFDLMVFHSALIFTEELHLPHVVNTDINVLVLKELCAVTVTILQTNGYDRVCFQ